MVAGDLPPGKWSGTLVGAWWPQAPTGLHDASRHWSDMSKQQENFAGGLNSTMSNLSRNKGVTAEDLIGQFNHGSNFHLDLAEKYQAKSTAFGSAADAIDNLRSGLTSIADKYNKEIEEAEKGLHGKGLSRALAIAKIAELITEANGQAAAKSAAAVAALTDALQKILTAEGSDLSPQEFLQSQGIQANDPKPINAEAAAHHGVSDIGDTGKSGTTTAETAGLHTNGNGAPPSDIGNAIDGGPEGPHVSPAGNLTPNGAPTINAGGGIHAPGGGGPHIPGGGVPGAGGLSPAALGNGLSPASLGKSFESGVQAGQPAAAGAQSLASGTMHAAAAPPPPAPAPEAPPVAPRSIPTLTASGGDGGFASSQHGGGASAAPVVSSPDHYTASPTVMAAPMSAPAAPVGGAPAAPAGPLPAYGSDLRPMTPAPPVAPAAPAGPVAGAPVAASPASSPAAGGLVSPVERSAPAAAAGTQANASGAAGAGLVSAAAGAVAGDAAKRVVAQRDLQAKVDAVARQEPAIAWAVGLLDDDTTMLLTTDVAGGWVPPYVKLPAGITLLEPSARRRDMSAVDLLGPVTVVAAYQPHGYIADAAPSDPALTGERARHGQYVDEFGPSLVDAVTRRSGLPAFTQGVAKAAVRRTGVLDSEADQLRMALRDIRAEVIGGYPRHKPELVANWMLLSAIEAVVDGHQELANYHLAWYTASFATTAGLR